MPDPDEPQQGIPERRINDQHIQTVCLMVLAAVAGVYLVYWLRPVLVPFIVACFIVSGVGPILTYLENRFGVSRVVAAGLAFLLGVALMGVFGLTISFSIIDLAKNKDDYRNRVRQLVGKLDSTFSADMFSFEPLSPNRAARNPDPARVEFVPQPFGDAARPKPAVATARNPISDPEAAENRPGPRPQPAESTTRDGSTGTDRNDAVDNDAIDNDAEPSDGASGERKEATPEAENAAEDDGEAAEDNGDTGEVNPEAKAQGIAEQAAEETDIAEQAAEETDTAEQPILDAVSPSGLPELPEIETVKVHSRAKPVSSTRMREATELVDAFVRDGISVVLQAFLNLVSTSVVVLIYVFFLLLGKPAYAQTGTMREIDSQIRGYLSLKTLISIGTGAVFGFALRLFGVPMALSFGVLAFLLNFIPNIGPIVASLLPIPLILLDPSGNVGWMISVIAVTSMIQLISGNVVEPKLMGNSSDLHPVTILLGLMFWGMMWGIIGMFLATPITAAMKIVLQRFEPTRQLANVMAGRWESNQDDEGNTSDFQPA